jgi:hypothetical protein
MGCTDVNHNTVGIYRSSTRVVAGEALGVRVGAGCWCHRGCARLGMQVDDLKGVLDLFWGVVLVLSWSRKVVGNADLGLFIDPVSWLQGRLRRCCGQIQVKL